MPETKKRNAATLRSRHEDTSCDASDYPLSLYHASPRTAPVDFDAILALQPYIKRVARRVVARSGDHRVNDDRELAAEMTHQIAERAACEPRFLSSNTAAYIVSFAVWRALNTYRRCRKEQYSLEALLADDEAADDEPRSASLLFRLSTEDEIDCEISVNLEAARLSSRARSVLSEIRDLLDEVLTDGGRLNEAEFARRVGRPQTTVHCQVDRLRRELAAQI